MAEASGPGWELDGPPRRLVVAGDWDGNQAWAVNVIRRVPQLLAGQHVRLILQLGDFGIWPDTAGKRYLASLGGALDAVGAQLWFIDGNHEDFWQLERMAGSALADGRVAVRPNIF